MDKQLTVDGGAVPCVATCSFCGSHAVSADATVIWGKDEQAWILSDTSDNNYCDNCGGECSLKFEPLEVAK